MSLRKKFGIAVLGLGIVTGGVVGVNSWRDNHGEGARRNTTRTIWQNEQYRAAIRKNMTPEVHGIYEQVMRGASDGPDGIICFTIPPGVGDEDAMSVTKIILAQQTVIGDTKFVVTRDTPPAGCKPPSIPSAR
jgi:hypothetical protein